MPQKPNLNIAVIYGGKSAEHEVSIQSAKNILNAIDRDKFNPVEIEIDQQGVWRHEGSQVALVPESQGKLIDLSDGSEVIRVDAAFPVLHGPFGEDGTIQGLLKLAGIPFVGAGVLGSAVGMDKEIMKRLLKEAGLPIGKFLVFKDHEEISYEAVEEGVGAPFFVKPANLGSSVGISKVFDAEDFKLAVKEAFKYDRKIIIEENIEGREIEVSVLGNDDPEASLPGEIIPNDEFYSYEAKYLDENGAQLIIPAKLKDAEIEKVKQTAVDAYQALACEGFARVDFFLTNEGEFMVNEINTIPGFTSISMYPMLWEKSGLSYTDLITRLIGLAVSRFEKEQKLKFSRL